MNKTLKILIAAVLALFIGLNLFLLYKEDNKIKRTSYVQTWKKAKKEDLARTLPSKGVVVPSEQQFVQHDPEKGSFNKFLVKEGEEVKTGTPLYSFIPENSDELAARLEAEKTAVQGAIDSTETHIQSLTSYQSSIESNTPAASDTVEAETNKDDLKAFEIEKEIYQLEADQSRLESKLSSIDTQLSSLGTSESEVTVESEIDGTVQKIRQDLKNPLITVSSSAASVEGILSENHRKAVKEGMKVKVSAQKGKGKSSGELADVSSTPEMEPHVKKKSQYTYTASIENQKPFTLIGSHVEVQIITKEVKDAIIVPKDSIFKEKKKHYVYVLGRDGLVHKTKVEAGAASGGKREVKSGLKAGDAVVLKPEEVVENKGPFFTPLHAGKVRMSEFIDMFEDKKWLIPFLTGIKEG
ncbi:HlyD family secretion protein [Peribacillus deserti]|uniref:HlyD family secretion protein n=1 Tax=Peribacillus deserti TaxID=673318 RepID=A0ABS2QDG6_9BACI|nr:efflux RND transporter periplasmic adaptor subunit [Peribacillus deserti]MBM7690724.1 HlyD family secretion protein [Peribacillus deserti]